MFQGSDKSDFICSPLGTCCTGIKFAYDMGYGIKSDFVNLVPFEVNLGHFWVTVGWHDHLRESRTGASCPVLDYCSNGTGTRNWCIFYFAKNLHRTHLRYSSLMPKICIGHI